LTTNKAVVNQVYNVACGERTTLNQLWQKINDIAGTYVNPIYQGERIGDIKNSLADISKIKKNLDYNFFVNINDGLKLTFETIK
jgi:UDP-N-acetylglucosamine 4-epimerase